jgi:tol-pal system protein YbgF
MRTRLLASVLALAATTIVLPGRVLAQNREHLQLTADLRMLQEQVSRLQLTVNQLTEQLKATNQRVDDQADANLKVFASQKATLDQVIAGLTTIREKLQDNDVRVGQLTQEMSTVRDGVRMLTDRLNTLVNLLQPPTPPAGADADTPPADGTAPVPSASSGGQGPLPPVTLQPSAGRIYNAAMGDYMNNHLDNAIEGFREVIDKFPDSAEAPNAQFGIGDSLYSKKDCRAAIPEYGKVISNYKTSERVPEAYYMQGVCYLDLNQQANARRMFETVVKQYPNTIQATLANQRLQSLPQPAKR